ncbi:SMI1/KNR4 family protein [Candidatus Methylacidiphilum fumarolicum]|nr:SMI1/KNR4 family protein [Candidatus Methylacidiphilum fumarolicum]
MPITPEFQALLEKLKSCQKEHPYIELGPPASPEAIEQLDKACQETFGVALPQDYKDFLAYAKFISFGYGWLYSADILLDTNSELKARFPDLLPPYHLRLGRSEDRKYNYDGVSQRYYIYYLGPSYLGVIYPKGIKKIPPEGIKVFYEDLYSLLKEEVEYFFRHLYTAPRLLEPREIELIQKIRSTFEYTYETSFLPPASFKAIEKADRQFREEFGVPIPEFYKKFLAFSNGFRSDLYTFFHIPDEDSPVEWLKSEEHDEELYFINEDFLIPHNRYYRVLKWDDEEAKEMFFNPNYFIFGQHRNFLEITCAYDMSTHCFFTLHHYFHDLKEEYPDLCSFLKEIFYMNK